MAAMTFAGSEQSQQAREFPSRIPLCELQKHFPARRLRYVMHVLSEEEINIVPDLRDALILARIKRMRPARLKHFDRFVPVDSEQQRAYTAAQMEWLQHEHYLLGTRLGRSPSHAELFADFTAHRNGLRFRAYYVMKYPKRMKRDGFRVG